MADGSQIPGAQLVAHAFDIRKGTKGGAIWSVPVEIAMALSRSSVMTRAIEARSEAGAPPEPMAKIFLQGERYFAIIDFKAEGRPQLVMPLDAWVRP